MNKIKLYAEIKSKLLRKVLYNFPSLDYSLATRRDIEMINGYLYNLYLGEELYLDAISKEITLEVLKEEFPGFKEFYENKNSENNFSAYEFFMSLNSKKLKPTA